MRFLQASWGLMLGAATALSNPTVAAEPLIGTWQAESGRKVTIARCGDAYCVTVVSGKYSGRHIGRFTGSDGRYTGEIITPKNNRSYAGSAEQNGTSLRVQGCALKVLCKSETWTKR
ncbi:DUF2147 domain-containing protein [Manganibacter manganicus]|uniref:DUF2147 domain-containing protein n=1 Tax=Manganibacter manganicus TaxID=1873176 RepID=A0A1V8RMK6_9HYPH|nr:DUF2147 domain-containing protein [Pseudaminobacter manganicus]OQM74435.1 hypothetical protein BFN67_22020 [Pseudaminobacter manganicus]